MKTPHFVMLVFLCLISLKPALAQSSELPRDTIYYHGTENLNMLILSKDYHQLAKDDQLQTMLKDFQNKLLEIQDNIPAKSSYIIHYQINNKLDINQRNIIKSYAITEEKGMVENFQNQAVITDPASNNQITLGFNDFEEILKTDFTLLLSEIISELPHQDRHLRVLEFQPDSQTKKARLTQNRPSGHLDMLSLQAGIGANVYKNRFLTDITGEIGLQLNQKGILRNQFYISNNLIFSFDSENSAHFNNFTNIGYRRNFSNQKDKSNWLGVELSRLTRQSGDVFKSNTMRLGVNWGVGKNITVAPQLYFNGLFQQVSPGFRIGIGL